MKKKNMKWVIMILILSLVIIIAWTVLSRSVKNEHNPEQEDGKQGTIEIKEKESTISLEVPVSEENENNKRESTEIDALVQETQVQRIEPTIVEVITDDPTKDVIIMADESGELSQVEIGVGEYDVTIPGEDELGENELIRVDGSEHEDILPETTEESIKDNSDSGNSDKNQVYQEIGPNLAMTYLEYEAMSGEEQMLYYYSFANADAFMEWYDAAKAEYEAENEVIYIGADGVVDIGSIGK